jgi:hypothetical protein
MDSNTMRRLCEYLHGLRCGSGDNNGTGQQPSFDTTTEDDAHWGQGNGSGDGGRNKDQPG